MTSVCVGPVRLVVLLALAATLGACASQSATTARPATTVATYTPPPPEVLGRGFGPIEAFIGQRFIGQTIGLEVLAADSNTLLLRSINLESERRFTGWELHKTTQAGVFTVVPVQEGRPNPVEGTWANTARLHQNGALEIVMVREKRRYFRYTFLPGQGTITRRLAFVNDFDQFHADTTVFVPDSEAGRQRARALAQQWRQDAADEAAEKRRARAEQQARVLGAIQGAVTEATAEADARRAAEDRRAAEAQRVAAARRAPASQTETAAASVPSGAAAPTGQATPRGSSGATRADPARANAAPRTPPQATSQASTDTDANRCVSAPETKVNDTYAGNTSATVLNGCGQPVDVRICLMAERKEGGTAWNCGVDYAVPGQGRASHSTFKATGPVFVDARVSSSKRPLAQPPGHRP